MVACNAMGRAVGAAALCLLFLATQGSARPSLSGYVDRGQLDVPWPKHSHYKQPWRGWLETVPATRLRDGLGIGYNWTVPRASDAVALRLLAGAGFTRTRVEISWDRVDYNTLELAEAVRARLSDVARAARDAGIRPLLLLNAHHGAPGPATALARIVRTAAPVGSRTLELDDVAGIRPRYTGLSNLTGFRMAEVLVTDTDPGTGRVSLSKPLPVALAAGQRVTLHTLRYLPLHEPGSAEFEATASGWLRYARSVARTVTDAGVADFDVEIWNELAFGSDFLDINQYYDPPLIPPGKPFLLPGGRAWELARRTVDMLAAEFPGARPIWGFSNTTFFQTRVTQLPAGTRGQSYHPYFFLDYRSRADEQYGFEKNLEQYAPPAPPYRVLMPETAATYLKTESLARLLEPGARQRRPRGVREFGHYMTEFGFSSREFGVADLGQAQFLKAKALLRGTLFWLNKGLTGLWLFSDYDEDDLAGYDLLPRSAAALTESPADPARYLTPALRPLGRVVALVRDARPIPRARAIGVELAAVDGRGGGDVFPGDASHPPLTNQDVFAVLPFQLDETSFLIATYVMSRNILAGMVPTWFLIRLTNVAGLSADVSGQNPMTGNEVPVEIVQRTAQTLTLRVPAEDYPYLWVVRERGAGTGPR
jgi:hypothetical protein